MKTKDLFEKWGLKRIQLKAGFFESEWQPEDPDKDAAWELYVELLTRITTQLLKEEDGDEITALDSVYKIFDLTRDVLKKQGRKCEKFTKIAIVVLNQVIRPFTAKWHKKKLNNGFKDPEICIEFRKELAELQVDLKNYTHMLADIADVEDLTELEK